MKFIFCDFEGSHFISFFFVFCALTISNQSAKACKLTGDKSFCSETLQKLFSYYVTAITPSPRGISVGLEVVGSDVVGTFVGTDVVG